MKLHSAIITFFFATAFTLSTTKPRFFEQSKSEAVQAKKEFKNEFGFTPTPRKGLDEPTLPEKAKEGITRAAKVYTIAGCIFGTGLLGYYTLSKNPSTATIKEWCWAALQSFSLGTAETVAAAIIL